MIRSNFGCGSGVLAFSDVFYNFTWCSFSLRQPASLAVIVENLRIAAPVYSCIQLAQYFVFGKMLVEDIVKKLIGNGVIGFPV